MGKKGVKTNNAVGVKGRSGRKTAREENAKLNAIILAWQKVLANIEKGDVEKIALPIALKDMATKHAGHDGKELPSQVLVKFLDDKSTDNNRDSE